MDELYDCIVVGAGYAGLSAAKALTENGKKVLVLEARNRVGGRAWTKQYEDGTYEDYGAAYLGVQQPNMYKLASEFGVRSFDVETNGNSVFHYGGKAQPYSSTLIPPLGPLGLLDSFLGVRWFERASKAVDLESPWKTPDAARLDAITTEEWLRSRFWTKPAQDTIRAAFELIWGLSTSQVSLLHALWYCKSGVSLTVLSTIDQGAQNQLMVGGGQAIANCIKDKLGEAVRLEEPVVSVDQSSHEFVVVTTTKKNYTGKCVIFAIPPPLILQVEFTPALPAQKTKLCQNTPMGAYWKAFATYESPFWRKDGLRGEVVSPDGFMALINDVSPEDSSRGVLMGFVVASKAMEFLNMTKESRESIVLKELVTSYGKAAGSPKKLNIHTMMEEKWSMGCPVATLAPGQWTSSGWWVRKPVGKIHWAGTETATEWSGYLEGAVNSGLRAAKEVLVASK